MNEEKPHLEEEFRARDEDLATLYDLAPEIHPDPDNEDLFPALNALKNQQSNYAHLSLIASGGQKKITKVYDHRLNRTVALAKPIHSDSPESHEKFAREAQLEANLNHPGIVPVLNAGIEADGTPFFTMELIQGDTLRTIINQLKSGNADYLKTYPLPTLLDLFLKICDALSYAHSRNVLHLDIKPENIRVGKFGEVFICDWGLAAIHGEHTPESQGLDGDLLNRMAPSTLLQGTPGFMAPEQIQSMGSKTEQTDIYSLGVLLYMLLTHRRPIAGRTEKELINNTCKGNIIPPRTDSRGAHISRSLAAVCMKALETNPSNRYSSVMELSSEIRRHLAGFPTKAENATLFTRFSLSIKRHNTIAGLSLFFLLILTITNGGGLLVISKKRAEATAAQKKAEENFDLFRQQQHKSIQLDAELSELIDFALQNRDYTRAEQKIRVLNIALQKAESPAEKKALLLQKGTMHFVLQQFRQATICFDKAGDGSVTDRDARKLSRKFERIKPDDKQLLPLSQLAQLIANASYNNKAVHYLYFRHMQSLREVDSEEYLPVATAMLNLINRINKRNYSTPINLSKRPEGYHLDLTRAPYAIYSLSTVGIPWKHILEPLNLYSLDISYLPLTSLNGLKSLQIEELRMTGVKISQQSMMSKHLKKMNVKKVIMDTSLYKDTTIKAIRKYAIVIHEDSK
jgi:tRNA A-37 threonylcarbamoyl transferase component Bud32